MLNIKQIAILILILLLSACSTSPKQGLRTINITTYDQLEVRFNDVLEECKPILQKFESKATHQARISFYLRISGLIAGSVFAPALAAVGESTWIIASLAGWAGSMNMIGSSLEASGLSGSTIAQTHNDIISNIRKNMKKALDGSLPFEQRRDAIMAIKAECIIYEIAVPDMSWTNN